MWAVVANGLNGVKVVIPFTRWDVANRFAERNPNYEVKLLVVAYLN